MLYVIIVVIEIGELEYVKRAAAPGQTVLLPCLLPNGDKRNWLHDEADSPKHHNITRDGIVTRKFASRFQLHAKGLLIRDVQKTDEGTYTCVDNHQRRKYHGWQTRLFVSCKSASLYLLKTYCSRRMTLGTQYL